MDTSVELSSIAGRVAQSTWLTIIRRYLTSLELYYTHTGDTHYLNDEIETDDDSTSLSDLTCD